MQRTLQHRLCLPLLGACFRPFARCPSCVSFSGLIAAALGKALSWFAVQDVTQSELDMLVRSVEHAQKVLQADEPGTRSLEDRHRALCAAMRQMAYKLPANLRAQQLMNAASVDLT